MEIRRSGRLYTLSERDVLNYSVVSSLALYLWLLILSSCMMWVYYRFVSNRLAKLSKSGFGKCVPFSPTYNVELQHRSHPDIPTVAQRAQETTLCLCHPKPYLWIIRSVKEAAQEARDSAHFFKHVSRNHQRPCILQIINSFLARLQIHLCWGLPLRLVDDPIYDKGYNEQRNPNIRSLQHQISINPVVLQTGDWSKGDNQETHPRKLPHPNAH